MNKIICFGDSSVYGSWDIEGGWVARLRRFFDEKQLSCNLDRTADVINSFVLNLGMTGGTTDDLVKRFELEAKPRLSQKRENIIIFGIGKNDAAIVNDTGKPWILQDKFEDNIKELIKTAKKFSTQIVFLGLSLPDDSKVSPCPWNLKISYNRKSAREFNDIIKRVCKENKVYFIDVIDKISTDMLCDGLHPGSEGHKKIFETVRDFLIKNKIINS